MKNNETKFDEIKINYVPDEETWNNIIDTIIEYLVENTYKEGYVD